MRSHRPFVLATFCAGAICGALVAAQPAPLQGDCSDVYFGIHHAPDFSRALKLCESERNWALLIVMHLNGEGTPIDVRKAEELLRAWQKEDPSQSDSLEAQALRQAIDQRKQHPGVAYPRLDFCRDVALDTVTMNTCASIDEEIELVKLESTTARTKAR